MSKDVIKKQEEENVNKTNRGFSIFNFKDSYGHMCSVQKSSSASEPKIWLGLDEIDAFTNVDSRIVKFTLPESVVVNARMHLNQEQVKKTITYFAKVCRYR